MLFKFAEARIGQGNISLDSISNDIDLDIENRMLKFAQDLKVIAPQAKDFLYFTCVMMHAAEASLLNDDGSFKKMADGTPVQARWEKVGEGVKWVSSDSSIRPYKNNNADIFPEGELKVAYKKWVGRPLCLDHQSQSVDKIRGVIVDTVWDDKRKRVIALCALDKKNYPDLAHKVSSGVATNVSMGTAVGRAVCTEEGCHRVARTERDFCNHMKNKSCYGEINLDLAPIELSLVVSGADPKAKVKHVIARDLSKAAEMLTGYLNIKEGMSSNELDDIKKDLASLTKKINELEGDDKEEETNDTSDVVGPTRSKREMVGEGEISDLPSIGAPGSPRLASELQEAILGAQVKIARLQETIEKLSFDSEETTMTTKKAYFQGTVEPKPGEVMYQPDPLADKARLMDKHLHGPAPFPNVGNVEDMYPGGDKEEKKKLQRLGEAERQMLREAAVKKAKDDLARRKRAYFQGTEEPTKYKVDPLADKAREGDLHLHGKKPFPEVGDVEGLYGDDESVKEKLSRASLTARFRKAAGKDGRLNKGASRWEVYANDHLILTASVNQLTNGNAENLYDAIATKKFGMSILGRIERFGFVATRDAILKRAQDPAAVPPPAPEAPPGGAAGAPPPAAPPAGEEAPAGDAPEAPKDVEEKTGVEGIVDDMRDLIDQIDAKISDLEDEALKPVQEDAKATEGTEPAPEAAFDNAEQPKTASELMSMRKTVNGMLIDSITETISDLKAHSKELRTARKIYASNYGTMASEQRKYLNNLTADAIRDAKVVLAETNELMGAVVKYAYGTAELEKKAAIHGTDMLEEFDEYPEGESLHFHSPLEDATDGDEDLFDIIGKGSEEEDEEDCDTCGPKGDKHMAADDDEGFEDESEEPTDEEIEAALADITDEPSSDETEAELGELGGFGIEGEEDEAAANDTFTGEQVRALIGQASLNTREGRAAARVKLAENGLSFNELSDQAHPGGSADIPGKLDTKPTVDFAQFHVFKDLKDAMMNLANLPPKVRKQAEEIHRLVQAGQLDPTDLDQLVSHGVDKEAVAYYKSYWAEAKDPESKDFASKLTQEHEKFKAAEELNVHKARIKRAYELANEMHSKGMIERGQIDQQVGEIMKWNDDGFNSIKSIVAKQAQVKTASMPQIGMLDSGDVLLPSAQGLTRTASSNDIKGFFDSYFAGKKL